MPLGQRQRQFGSLCQQCPVGQIGQRVEKSRSMRCSATFEVVNIGGNAYVVGHSTGRVPHRPQAGQHRTVFAVLASTPELTPAMPLV